jgi:predicted NAD/FAD-binding protein
LLRHTGRVAEEADPLLTHEEFLGPHRFTRSARRRLIDPLLQAGWCLDWDDLATFSAYDVLSYFALNRPDGVRSPPMCEVVGGPRPTSTRWSAPWASHGAGAASRFARVTREEVGIWEWPRTS